MLVLSTDHNHGIHGDRGSQTIIHQNKFTIQDMVDLYILLGQSGTMFFNGFIGNSERHFHFHITSEKIPIQNIIHNWNNDDLTILNTKRNNKIILFNHNKKECLNGILFFGNHSSIHKDIFSFLKSINQKKLLYNILFIENKLPQHNNNKITIIIYLRKKITSQKIHDFNMGSSSIGGILITKDNPTESLNSKKLINKIQKYCNVTLIKPTKQLFNNIL